VGEGGMATVYRAKQRLSERMVALKILNRALIADAKLVERFRREAKHSARLAHPNIVEVFESGETEDQVPYFVMELLDGEPLDALIERGAVDASRAISIFIQIARAIARAHDLDVVHRDLKPENIYLCTGLDGCDLVKVLDFGIARAFSDGRLTVMGELFGTPQYMSPGRIKGLETTRADDLYAMGVLMFEICTGRLPFEASDVGAFFMKHLTEPAPDPRKVNPRVPEALASLIMRLMAKEEKGRPIDAHGVEAELMSLSDAQEFHVPTREVEVNSGPATMDGAAEAWTLRLFAAEDLLNSAYGEVNSVPVVITTALEAARMKIGLLRHAADELFKCEESLSEIERQGREGRHSLGFALDALGQDASRSRQEQRDIDQEREALAEKESELQRGFILHHQEMLQWEGRFAFQSPTTALAESYREAAEILDAWREHGMLIKQADEVFEQKSKLATDIEYQVTELRSALTSREEGYEERRAAAAKDLELCAKSRDATEASLRKDWNAVLAPLRDKPAFTKQIAEFDAAV
jgi:eukaryotic-like serine/threonine-protein kinase